jgi:hypothetical protein
MASFPAARLWLASFDGRGSRRDGDSLVAVWSVRMLRGLLLVAALSLSLAAPAWAQSAAQTDGLATYTTPSGATVRVDARLVAGLDVLRQLAAGRELLEALGRGGVSVAMAPEPLGVWAHYDADARLMIVDVSLAGADPRTLAALISHEAVHARDTQAGQRQAPTRATGGACFAGEAEAMRTELAVWQELFGPQGKAPAEHAYEREQNTALARNLSAPDRYWDRVAAAYARVCGS